MTAHAVDALANHRRVQAQLEKESTARSLREWMLDAEILTPPVAVIPHIAIEGRVSLLSGKPKIGKTTLAAVAVAAASRGESFLGTPVLGAVDTLWYNNDEPIPDTVRRFKGLGANPDTIVLNDTPRLFTDLLTALDADVSQFDPDLVIVDNLSRVFAVSGIDPNSSREVEPVIARLVDYFHRSNLSAILLYHTGKSGREYRGSTAIGATVDEILTLRRRGQAEEDDFEDDTDDDGRRLLVQEGRNLRGRIHLTCVDGIYRLFDEARPPRTKILETLSLHGSVSGRSALVKLASVRKAIGLHAITDLINDGAITEKQRRLSIAPLGTKELEFLSSAQFPEGGTDNGTGSRFQRVALAGSGTVIDAAMRCGVAESS